jgi:thiol-disulfide isomerase/thioredoxin
MDTDNPTPPSKPSRRPVLGVAVAALAAGVGLGWWRHQAQVVPQAMLTSLWTAEFEQPDGGVLKLADFQGKPLVLNFWATWCTPCIEEMPLLNAFFLENKPKNWQMLGLAIDQPSAVKRYLAQHPVEYPIGLAGLDGTQLMKDLGNTAGGLPFTLVIDAPGLVQVRKLGKLSLAEIQSWA